MKTKTLIIAISMSIINLAGIFAQNNNENKKIEIKTSAVCGMCKATINKALSKVDGVQEKKLDLKTKIITVIYDPQKTSPEKIRTAITMAGYDADDMPADATAYSKLDGCCKKQ